MRNRFQRVSLADVAIAAGVSKQTVSRVVNDYPYVAEETRVLVQKAIKKMGYRRNEIAHNLMRGRSYTLGVVGDDVSYFGSQTYIGSFSQAEALGYSLIQKDLPHVTPESVEAVLHSFLDKQVDGVFWAIPETGDNLSWLDNGVLQDFPVPIVFTSMAPRAGVLSVAYDNFESGRMGTRYLVEKGRRHIGHITGPLRGWVSRERQRGWGAALKEAGRETSPDHLAEGDWTSSSGVIAFQRLFESYPEMDAVFVSNDRMAMGALLAAHQLGLRIPEDIALVGLDNSLDTECFYPPLTTVVQNKKILGELTIRTLVQQVEAHFSGDVPLAIDLSSLQHHMVVRESA